MASVWKNPWVRRQRLRFRRPLQILVSPIAANYIRLVIKTSTIVADPPDYVDMAHRLHPSIIALWHGQFFLLAGIYPPEIPGRAMVARHDDAEALARVLHGAVASLREGFSVAMTADVPPGPARKCGLGIVTIGSLSGRPIVPFAVATSRYRAINSWSRMTINLPFSRLGIVMGDPIYVPPGAGREELELYRKQIEAALNETTAKAYALAGADPARATPPSVERAPS
jgi:3-deoxy-D-manno-octulosonic-acid transferase